MCGPPPDRVGPTYDQQVQADINNKMWQNYQENYKPAIDKYIASRTDPSTTEAEKKKVAGQVNADVMKTVKPASATNSTANVKNMAAAADVKSSAEELGKTGVKAKQIGTEENIINIGKGQATKTMSGLDELAGMSVTAALQDRAREEQTQAVTENAIGAGIGTAAAVGLKYGPGLKGKTMDDQTLADNSPGSW